MDTLFSSNERVKQLKNAPLAVRMRPSTLDDYVGQKKAVGPGSWLRSAIEHDVLSSVILYGPAGTGKTTLAHIIARRIMIQASEDIGNADPTALLVAEAAFKAAEVIGYPECRINLAQAAIYNALAPKSNAAEAAIDAALADVRTSGQREVPSYLRDRHRPGSDEYGDYKYPHDYPQGWVEQRYLPEGLERGAFWQPSGRGWEQWRAENKPR